MQRPHDIPPDWIELEFTVPKEHAGWRADIFISHQIPRLSRTRVQRVLNRSAYDALGRRVKPNRTLRDGERITIFRPPPEDPEVPRYFDVLYEDDVILGIYKPPGLPVHPTARYLKNTLTGLLEERFGADRPILAHRIDSETSGVLLLAKTKDVERKIKQMFKEREIQKRYLAVVRGVPSEPDGRIEEPLGPDPDSPIRVKMACRPDGLPALTHYRVMRSSGDEALLECLPRTGRQHQIRAHLAHLGHPVVGDKMYGADASLFLDYIDNGPSEDISARAGADRQLLHAAQLTLKHPVTGSHLTIESPLPEDMASRVH